MQNCAIILFESLSSIYEPLSRNIGAFDFGIILEFAVKFSDPISFSPMMSVIVTILHMILMLKSWQEKGTGGYGDNFFCFSL